MLLSLGCALMYGGGFSDIVLNSRVNCVFVSNLRRAISDGQDTYALVSSLTGHTDDGFGMFPSARDSCRGVFADGDVRAVGEYTEAVGYQD